MGDLNSMYKAASNLKLSLREGLERLESLDQGSRSEQSSALARSLEQKLADLQRLSQQLDAQWRMQVVGDSTAKRDLWKRKVEQVTDEAAALREALDKHMFRERRRQVEAQQRSELLERRANGGSASWMEPDVQGSIHNSRRVLEETFQTGTHILTNMAGQRERLKSAQRKMLDVLNSVGLSDSLLRVIERRQKLDKWITYGGMALTLLLLTGLWWWLRR